MESDKNDYIKRTIICNIKSTPAIPKSASDHFPNDSVVLWSYIKNAEKATPNVGPINSQMIPIRIIWLGS